MLNPHPRGSQAYDEWQEAYGRLLIAEAIAEANSESRLRSNFDLALESHKHFHRFGKDRVCERCGLLEIDYNIDKDKIICEGLENSEIVLSVAYLLRKT